MVIGLVENMLSTYDERSNKDINQATFSVAMKETFHLHSKKKKNNGFYRKKLQKLLGKE